MKRLFYRFFPTNGRNFDYQCIEKLTNYVKYGKQNTRIWAIESLSKKKSKEAINSLKLGLNDKSLIVRSYAALGLAKNNIPDLEIYLLEALKTDSYIIKSDAAIFLGNYSNDKVVDALIDLLDDQWSNPREEAIRSLGNIRNDKAIIPIFNCFKKEIDFIYSDTKTYVNQGIYKLYRESIISLVNIGGIDLFFKLLIEYDSMKAFLVFTSTKDEYLKRKLLNEWKINEKSILIETILYYSFTNEYYKISTLGPNVIPFIQDFIKEYMKRIENRYKVITRMAEPIIEDFSILERLVVVIKQLKDKRNAIILFDLYRFSKKYIFSGERSDIGSDPYTVNYLIKDIQTVYKEIENRDIYNDTESE